MLEWKPVVGYPNYIVSNTGYIKGIRGSLLKRQRSRRGWYYPFINLYRAGARKNITVHAVVAKAFLGPKPEGYEIHHIDCDIENANVSNLEYVTKEKHKQIHLER